MEWRKSVAAGEIGNKKEGSEHGRYMPCGDAKACQRVGGRGVGGVDGGERRRWRERVGASGQPEGGTERAPGVGGSTAPQAWGRGVGR